MAVILQMTYQKKLGLPNYSSHACSASLSIEITDASVAAEKFASLYDLLQSSVDKDIQKVGFMPDASTYGMNNGNSAPSNGRQATNGNGHPSNGNGHSQSANRNGEHWNCTDGQKSLILRVINENNLNKQDIEDQAQQLFGVGVKDLSKMQASQLIEELLEKLGKKPAGQRRWSRQPAHA